VGYWAERVEGRSLAEIISSGTRYGVNQACLLVTAISGAVDALHGAGLSNGGISAAHVVESTDKRVVLLPSVCVSGQLGTNLLSPCTPAVDILDLGALLVLLLTGIQVQQPFEPALLDRVRQIRPDVRPPLIAVLGRSLSGDAQHRFSSAIEFEHAIRMAMVDGPVTKEWVIGFVVTTLVMLLLVWYALATH
jgi:hypothetical protein